MKLCGATMFSDLKLINWKIPYNITVPIAKYVSSEKGGLISLSSLTGCDVWPNDYDLEIGSEGDLEHASSYFNNKRKVNLNENTVYVMSSNTPHASLPIEAGKRRTLMRITLNENYPNKLIFNT